MPGCILVLDCALGTCATGIFALPGCMVELSEAMERGQAARLPALLAELLARAHHPRIDLIGATVGPGSFTGIRAGLALAHGLAAGWGCALVGVRCDEALAEELDGTGEAWITLPARPGRVFLSRGGVLTSCAIADLPLPEPGTRLAGTAAAEVAAALAARGATVAIAPVFTPAPRAIAVVAARRAAGLLPPLDAQPLYVDAPEARSLPARS